MISNEVKIIDSGIVGVPLIIRADHDGWVPTFDMWYTKISGDTSYIDCTQKFGEKTGNYEHAPIDPLIGYYKKESLIIHWKALIDSGSVDRINNIYNGKLRATCWRKRYCTYFGTGSKMPWLHSVVLDSDVSGYVVHHINGVSVDNRGQNLHILRKREHDSIDHPKLDEREKMFLDPEGYWRERKRLAMDSFIMELALIISDDARNHFISKFAASNPRLAREILEVARLCINLSRLNSVLSNNRTLNSHLNEDYLDTYEIEQYLKKHVLKSSGKLSNALGQLRLF